MKPRFHLGQRVRLVRESPCCEAPVGTLGTVTAYRGANADGTDWELDVALDGAVTCEPPAWVDEACLAQGDGDSEPLPVEDACLDAEGVLQDTVETTVHMNGARDHYARVARVVLALQPLLGGAPRSTECSEYRGRDGQAILELCTTWCGSRAPIDVVVTLCGRFPGSRRIIDDGWSVEFGLSRDDVQGLLGADALECRVIVEPWSSFARRPESDRFVYDDGCGLADWLS